MSEGEIKFLSGLGTHAGLASRLGWRGPGELKVGCPSTFVESTLKKSISCCLVKVVLAVDNVRVIVFARAGSERIASFAGCL